MSNRHAARAFARRRAHCAAADDAARHAGEQWRRVRFVTGNGTPRIARTRP